MIPGVDGGLEWSKVRQQMKGNLMTVLYPAIYFGRRFMVPHGEALGDFLLHGYLWANRGKASAFEEMTDTMGMIVSFVLLRTTCESI